MNRIKEKLKAIWHIIADKEYAVFTVTIKNGKRVRGRACCIISDNASKPFINSLKTYVNERLCTE